STGEEHRLSNTVSPTRENTVFLFKDESYPLVTDNCFLKFAINKLLYIRSCSLSIKSGIQCSYRQLSIYFVEDYKWPNPGDQL
ncbi:unnamed protein product, partial [Porites evermanni]